MALLAVVFAAGPIHADPAEEGQFDLANGLLQRGYFDMAAEEYQNYIEKYPQGAHLNEAVYRLGESQYNAGQYDAALGAFDRVLTSGAEEATKNLSRLRRGEILYRLSRLDEATEVLKPLTAESVPPEIRAGALYYQGKLDFDSGRHEAAREGFRTLVESLPDNPMVPYARYQLALVNLALKDYEGAATEFSAVADSNADEALRIESRFQAAEAYDRRGWSEAAATAYKKLLADFPGSTYAERAAYGYAWALFHAGSFAESREAAGSFVKEHPESASIPGLKYLMANCLQQQKEYDKAEEAYRNLIEAHPDSAFAPRAQYKIAWTRYLRGDLEGAKNEVSRFLETYKDASLVGDAAFLRGTILASEDNWADAYEEFRLVAEKYVDSEFAAEALYKMGEALVQLGRIDEAGTVFTAFATQYPDNPLASEAILRLGDAKFYGAKFRDAIAEYQRILDSAPDPAKEENALYRMAYAYFNIQDYKSCAETFQRLLEKYPQTPHRAEAFLRIGDYQVGDGNDPVHAIEAFQNAFDTGPKGPFAGRALRGLAIARHKTNDLDGAAEAFFRVMEEFPDVKLNEQAYAWLGDYTFQQENWNRSAQALDALLKAFPDYPNPERVHLAIAECSERAGKREEAIKLYQKVVDAAPQSSAAQDALFKMAGLYEAGKDVDKAMALYEQAANTNTGETAAKARFRIGELHETKGDCDGAARSFMQVAILFLHPELSPESLWRAGQCFEKMNSADQAKRAYDELIKEYPESEQA
ncbi:MAG: tetratricopeptide repeat protein, partial [Candidatus Hydrogenedentes bacterium]|nr:tetratricopeptide repeat protein [Candidatus Hydrogenedentota bacterium]